MRIDRLLIENFRGIARLELDNLQSSVLIAGPNGCGKSCVFDAIRLVKSVYGAYNQNEVQNWFGEFQTDPFQRPGDLERFFLNRQRALTVEADFQLSPEEQQFLRESVDTVLAEHFWREAFPGNQYGWGGSAPVPARMLRAEPEVMAKAARARSGFLNELSKPVHAARLRLATGRPVQREDSFLLDVVFSRYDPRHLGIIDYHGPNRTYAREAIAAINLAIEVGEQKMRDHALYNYANKYTNLKGEIAGGYIREMLGQKAAGAAPVPYTLASTLTELFATFFPGKTFLGPRPTPDGRLLFPVRTAGGGEHDIDDLSSGEKEILYGYLRIRNSAPRNSVLLIDEPELHLNPKLIDGLARFYHRELGMALGSQIWLVTHSDRLIRDAVGQAGFSVFHLQTASDAPVHNQASRVRAQEEVEKAVIDVVGDLAVYRPGAKVVVFEGGGDSDFDQRMTLTLFPVLSETVNPVSGGNKQRVRDLYEVLSSATKAGGLPIRVFAVCDPDDEPLSTEVGAMAGVMKWDTYHIENYLLDASFIQQVLLDIEPGAAHPIEDIEASLNACAVATLDEHVSRRLHTEIDRLLRPTTALAFDHREKNVVDAANAALVLRFERLSALMTEQLAPEGIRAMLSRIRAEAERQLSDGTWRARFRGRDILRRYAGRLKRQVKYELLRDLILARMRDAGHKPPGMQRVVERILSA